MKQSTLSSTLSTRPSFQPHLWWLLAFLVIALPLVTVVQATIMILPPLDCNPLGDSTQSGAVKQFCFPSLTPQYGQGNIVVGPDGNLWFLEQNKVGRVTPNGQLTEFPAYPASGILNTNLITKGPDGTIWFLEDNGLVRISTDGAAEKFGSGVVDSPSAITVGPDGNLWIGNNGFLANEAPTIVKMTPAGESVSFPLPTAEQISHGASQGGGIIALVAGADGNLWFLLNVTVNEIHALQGVYLGSMTPSGMIKQAPMEIDQGSGPPLGGGIGFLHCALAVGADGNLWFMRHDGQIGRVTPTGSITHFQVPGQSSQDMPILVKGADGNLWFSASPGQIGRFTPDGQSKLFPLPAQARIGALAAAPDGHLWFLNAGDTQKGSVWWVHIGRFTLSLHS